MDESMRICTWCSALRNFQKLIKELACRLLCARTVGAFPKVKRCFISDSAELLSYTVSSRAVKPCFNISY